MEIEGTAKQNLKKAIYTNKKTKTTVNNIQEINGRCF